jgi:hypothetical protein
MSTKYQLVPVGIVQCSGSQSSPEEGAKGAQGASKREEFPGVVRIPNALLHG